MQKIIVIGKKYVLGIALIAPLIATAQQEVWTYHPVTGNDIRGICADVTGKLWMAAGNAAISFNGMQSKVYDGLTAPISGFRACAKDRQGHIWFIHVNKAAVFNGTSWSSYTTLNPTNIIGNSATSVAVDAQNVSGSALQKTGCAAITVTPGNTIIQAIAV